jgi:hypothetical protein
LKLCCNRRHHKEPFKLVTLDRLLLLIYIIIVQHPVAHHLLVNVTAALSHMQHCLKTINFFKKLSTICFGLYGRHQVLQFLWRGIYWAHLVLFHVRSHYVLVYPLVMLCGCSYVKMSFLPTFLLKCQDIVNLFNCEGVVC